MAGVKHYAHLHFIVLLWGFTAILGLLINIPAVELVFYRTLLSFLGLFILLYVRKMFVNPGRLYSLKFLSTGILFSAHWIFFFEAARVSNASVTLVGMSTVTLWTALLGPLLTRQKLKVFEVVLGVFIILGIYIVFKADLTYKTGLIMAMIAAICAALFMLINSGFTRQYNHFVIMSYEMLGACITTALFLPIYKVYLADGGKLHMIPSALDWIFIFVLALVCTVYAYSASIKLMKKFTPYTINLVANMEPVYGILLALVIFGDREKMTYSFYLGAFIIIAAVFCYPVLNRILMKKKISLHNVS